MFEVWVWYRGSISPEFCKSLDSIEAAKQYCDQRDDIDTLGDFFAIRKDGETVLTVLV
jgi:hypothetical protein